MVPDVKILRWRNAEDWGKDRLKGITRVVSVPASNHNHIRA
jgi:hypothetical protein